MDELERRYGPWAPIAATEVTGLLGGFDAPWWVAGGCAVEAFTGVPRRHDDIDVVMFRRDLPRLRTALAGRFHLWSVGAGMLRPLDDRYPDLHPDAEQVWVREHALAPWVADILQNPDRDGSWVNKRWPDHVAPLEEVTWVAPDGVRYLAPEIALLFKASHRRPKDELDLEAAWPLLDAERRGWLLRALEETAPDNPWLHRLAGA